MMRIVPVPYAKLQLVERATTRRKRRTPSRAVRARAQVVADRERAMANRQRLVLQAAAIERMRRSV